MASILEVRHLEMIAAICETGTVARAAERLHLSQPALSHALRSLEDRLGVRLFERARRMTPTPAGVETQQLGKRVLALINDGEARLRLHKDGAARVIRVATDCYTCYHWLPPVFRTMRTTNPGVSVRIVGEATSRALDALLNGELDLAVLHFKPVNKRLAVEKLFADEQLIITSPDHPFARKRFIVPQDLATERLLTHRDPEHTYFWKTFLEPAGVRPVESTSLHATEAVVESVKAGLGVGVMARWAVQHQIHAGDLAGIRIGPRGLTRSWYAAMLRGRVDPASATLLSLLKTDAVKAVKKVAKKPQ